VNVSVGAASPEDAGSPEDSEDESSDADKNLEITCRDCHKGFIFTADQQRSFELKGYAPPIRCAECRIEARAKKGIAEQAGTLITFLDCEKEFCFTESKQVWYTDNHVPPPIRCYTCWGKVNCESCDKIGHATDECRRQESNLTL
jgi:hypothetical protein